MLRDSQTINLYDEKFATIALKQFVFFSLYPTYFIFYVLIQFSNNLLWQLMSKKVESRWKMLAPLTCHSKKGNLVYLHNFNAQSI